MVDAPLLELSRTLSSPGQPDQTVVFKFTRMTAEQAATVVSRMKARWNYMEMIRRELDLIEGRPEIPEKDGLPAVPALPPTPTHLIDDAKYVALLDKRDSMALEFAKSIKPIFDQIKEPDEKRLNELVDLHPNLLMDVTQEYFAALFPAEGDRKKS